jgi:hypothetical protein
MIARWHSKRNTGGVRPQRGATTVAGTLHQKCDDHRTQTYRDLRGARGVSIIEIIDAICNPGLVNRRANGGGGRIVGNGGGCDRSVKGNPQDALLENGASGNVAREMVGNDGHDFPNDVGVIC